MNSFFETSSFSSYDRAKIKHLGSKFILKPIYDIEFKSCKYEDEIYFNNIDFCNTMIWNNRWIEIRIHRKMISFILIAIIEIDKNVASVKFIWFMHGNKIVE